jgi:hypothetical protein
MFRVLTTVVAGLLLLAATAVSAQDQGRDPANAPSRPTPDFLFGKPRGSLGLRGSWLFASANSDLYDFVQTHLTVDKKDWNAPMIGVDAAWSITSRIDIGFGLEISQAHKASEYRDFVDNRLLPINQETTLKERNIYGSVRFSLVPRGRSISRFAWVPRGFTPYVGAGAGALWYKFEQSGDFVDFADLSVFTDFFSSAGYAPSAHVFGGSDIQLYRILFLTVEGRYVWANAKLGRDFIDFDPIDLAGFRLSTGVNVRF